MEIKDLLSLMWRKARILIAGLVLGLGFGFTLRGQEKPQLPEDDQCINCHMDDDNLPDDFHEFDIHLQQGLSCAGCHGGDATTEDEDKAMSPK